MSELGTPEETQTTENHVGTTGLHPTDNIGSSLSGLAVQFRDLWHAWNQNTELKVASTSAAAAAA